MANPSTITCPTLSPSTSVLAVNPGKVQISTPATPESVLGTLLDTTTWPAWNTFVPSLTYRSQPTSVPSPNTLVVGSKVTFMVHMDPKRADKGEMPLDVAVTLIDRDPKNGETRVCWVLDPGWWVPQWILYSERMHVLTGLEGGGCEVETLECMTGVLAWYVRWRYGKILKGKFAAWLMGLRDFVEKEGPK